MPKYYLITFGCQMNKNDSERIESLLLSLKYSKVEKAEEADLIIINTCSVRQSAEDRVYGLVRNWQKIRKVNPRLVIAITGCLPGRDKDGKIKNKLKGVDLFFGIEQLPMLPRWLSGLSVLEEKDVESVNGDYLTIVPNRSNRFQAYITIQTGCDNYCSYCVVPHARGRQKNRPIDDILAEVRQATVSGCKEITLLGQVVNSREDFAILLKKINEIQGIERVHFTASHPECFSDAQIEALKLPKQVNYFHLPVQSGDNEVLKKMNRKYTREQYIELINRIRQAKPDIAIGTDIIVGFCGETDEQFQNTVDLYRECDFDICYTAMYSERSGTAAAKTFKDNVPYQEKKKRWKVIQDLMEETTYRKNQKYLGKIVNVLVESCEAGICSGQSNEMKLVEFLGNLNMIGQIIPVKITWAGVWALKGEKVRSMQRSIP